MWTRKLLFLAVGALALLFFAYGNHYRNGFHFDDTAIIENNSFIQSPDKALAIFTDKEASSSHEASRVYRPVALLSLAADYWRAGLDVHAYHHSAFVLYLILLLLLFLFFRKLAAQAFDEKAAAKIAFASTVVFGFHAVHAETINYISARGCLLGALFSVLALHLYVRPGWTRTRRIYLLPLACAILSERAAISLVAIIFFHHLIFESQRGEPEMRRLKRATLACLPALTVAALCFGLTIMMSASEALGDYSIEYFLTQPYVIAEYIASFFYPIGISAASGVTIFNEFDSWRSLCGQVFLVCLLALAAFSLRGERSRLIGFGLLWFLAALVPSSWLLGSDVVLDYRRTFFAYSGLAFAMCVGAALQIENWKARPGWRPRYSTYMVGLALLVLATHILVTRQRNRVWQTEETLWFDVLAKNPGYGPGYMAYGLSKMAKNDYDLARLYLEEALKYLPDDPQLNTDLGTLHGKISKDPKVAKDYFEHAISVAPDYAPAYLAYGRWLLGRRKYDSAIEKFEKAVALSDTSPLASYALMDTYSELGRWAKVREVARLTLALRPDDAIAKQRLALADARPAEDARRGVKSSARPAQRPQGSSQTPG